MWQQDQELFNTEEELCLYIVVPIVSWHPGKVSWSRKPRVRVPSKASSFRPWLLLFIALHRRNFDRFYFCSFIELGLCLFRYDYSEQMLNPRNHNHFKLTLITLGKNCFQEIEPCGIEIKSSRYIHWQIFPNLAIAKFFNSSPHLPGECSFYPLRLNGQCAYELPNTHLR